MVCCCCCCFIFQNVWQCMYVSAHVFWVCVVWIWIIHANASISQRALNSPALVTVRLCVGPLMRFTPTVPIGLATAVEGVVWMKDGAGLVKPCSLILVSQVSRSRGHVWSTQMWLTSDLFLIHHCTCSRNASPDFQPPVAGFKMKTCPENSEEWKKNCSLVKLCHLDWTPTEV